MENSKPKWKDFGHLEGFFISSLGNIHPAIAQSSNDNNKNTLPSVEYCKAIIALCQLINWRDKYNNNWIPDWNDTQDKHIIGFCENEISLEVVNHFQFVLAFKTEEIAKKFKSDFEELIWDAKPLL